MLIRARASFSATRASLPGLFRSLTTKAGSSLARYLAARRARLAFPALLTRIPILPRPAASPAQSAVMLTPASASVRATWARTPGLDRRDSESWVVFGMAVPPPQRSGCGYPTPTSAHGGREDATDDLGGIRGEQPGGEPAGGAADGDEGDARVGQQAAGLVARGHLGVPVAWIVGPLPRPPPRPAPGDRGAEGHGVVQRDHQLRRHARLAAGQRAEPEGRLVEQRGQGHRRQRAVRRAETLARLPRAPHDGVVVHQPHAQPQRVVDAAREARRRHG